MSEHRQRDGSWKVDSGVTWPGVYGLADSGLARAIQCLVGRGTLVDIGAGAGSYGAWLEGCAPRERPQWIGYDGNVDVESFTRHGPPGALTRYLNLCDASARAKLPMYDWAMSIEVGEHLPATCIPNYLALLNATARYGIVLSWYEQFTRTQHFCTRLHPETTFRWLPTASVPASDTYTQHTHAAAHLSLIHKLTTRSLCALSRLAFCAVLSGNMPLLRAGQMTITAEATLATSLWAT